MVAVYDKKVNIKIDEEAFIVSIINKFVNISPK
jgi:hypothetical protein